MIDKFHWQYLYARNPQEASAELRARFVADDKFRNEVLDSIPEDKIKELKETYMTMSKFKHLTFEEWFDYVRKTGFVVLTGFIDDDGLVIRKQDDGTIIVRRQNNGDKN